MDAILYRHLGHRHDGYGPPGDPEVLIRILYIWDGRNPLPESRAEAIQATMDLYPDAEYSCITRAPHFFSDRFKVIDWDSYGREMAEGLGLKRFPFHWVSPVCFSDWARFWFLGNNPNTLYLDTDCRMAKWYCFEAENKVVHSPGNICLLYSPESSKGNAFSLLLLEQSRRAISRLMGIHTRFGAWAKALPKEYFRHR